ncbi:zinc ribbon domain-containing protein [Geoalkalibacter sp.]|uniref:zinc ribbon domain-containing protein n=1 Tax=Geoalkalibacter sp. TaxID=3041440 RepID=UPI00272E83F8|nr:C4-type zinc ribbon domain-containing protein [Geoalkalibacter sp.]
MEAKDVQEQMRLLKDLQDIDTAARKIRLDRQQMEQELGSLDAEVERVRVMVTGLREGLDALRAERRELGQALALERDNVARAESRLPAIKTQKEYIAVLKEVDTAKKMNRDIEERIKGKDAEIAALDQDLQEKEKELAEQEDKANARRALIEEQLAEIDATLSSREAERAAIAEQIPLVTRKRYQTLLDRRGGIAVVEARQGACQGCHMQLPPQVFNSLFRQEEVMSCPHCHRLIFLIRQ